MRGGRRTWWLAPTYPMASQVWKDLKATMRNVCGTTISEALHQMDFPGGGSIAIRSTHAPDHLRGAGLDFAVLDEAAFMEARVWSEVVRPMLLDRQGGAIFLSTPCGRNWFYDLYRLGLNAQEPAWAAFHFTSLDNPLIAPAEFDTIRRTTPERIWRSEYLAEFVDDAGQVFRGIQEAATVPLSPVPQPGHRYVLGVDWGREQDFTCLVVIDATTQQMVALERFNKIGWQLQRGRLQALVDVWRPQVIYAEANSIGSVNIEALQAEGLAVRPFMTTARSKPPLIEALALAIERGDLALLADEVLLHELGAYALERLPGGGYRYSAPAGAHDDTVIALALAWHAAQSGGVSLDFA
ncbi:MAG: terminase family protein [Anaerolineae bacterium]|nr:terminase family protein [Anaerolineae bacterium]